MSIIDNLKLSQTQRPTDLTQEQRLRMKMSEALDRQIAAATFEAENKTPYAPSETRMAKNAETGAMEERQVRVRFSPWWFKDENGKLFLALRYGNKPVEIRPKKTSIEIPSEGTLVETMQALQQAIQAGELDQQLCSAADARRAQLKKRTTKRAG